MLEPAHVVVPVALSELGAVGVSCFLLGRTHLLSCRP
jgi:hypothetical protein